jgi:hypothetical protein
LTKALLVLHAALFVLMAGAATHNAVFTFSAIRGGTRGAAHHRRWVRVLACAYVASMLLGLTLYPDYRTGVRAAYLDAAVPLATGFFDVKEHWIGAGLFGLLWYAAASRRFDPKNKKPWHLPYHLTGLTLTAAVWLAGCVGLVLVAVRSV